MSGLWAELRRNLAYRVLALILAVGLATRVLEDDTHVQEFVVEVGLRLKGVPTEKIFVGELPARLAARVRGPESELLDVVRTAADLRWDVDLSAARDGAVIPFDSKDLEALLGARSVQVLSTTPPSLVVRLARRLTRKVEVRPQFDGSPPAGYRLEKDDVRVSPATVEISGPEDVVLRTPELQTAPIALNDLDRPGRFHVPLVRPEGFEHVLIEHGSVTVHVPVTTEIHRREERYIPVAVQGCPVTYECVIEPPHVSVRMHGPLVALSELLDPEPPPDLVRVQLTSAQLQGNHTIPVRVAPLPAEVDAHVIPATVKVTVTPPPPPPPPPTPDAGSQDVDAGPAEGGGG